VLHPAARGPVFPGRQYPVGTLPLATAVGDLDGDGDPDLAVSCQDDGTWMLMNNGDGTFSSGGLVAFGYRGIGIAADDFDGDGDLDLAAALDRMFVRVALNDGAGGFTQIETVLVGSNDFGPSDVVARDIDGNGIVDLVVLSSLDGDGIVVLPGAGDGTFGPPQAVRFGFQVGHLIAEDLDGDGDVDLASVKRGGHLHLRRNAGAGVFGEVSITDLGIWPSILACDVDGDGDQDVLAATSQEFMQVSLNRGDGTFEPAEEIPTPDEPKEATTFDLDGDGDLDICVSNSSTGRIARLINDGTGTFTLGGTSRVGTVPGSLTGHDFDGDGNADLAVLMPGGNDVSVVLNRGGGTFDGVEVFDTWSSPRSMAAGDIDGDGDQDLALGYGITLSKLSFMSNDGQGSLTTMGQTDIDARPEQIALMDADQDGDLDLAVCDVTTRVSLYLNDGSGVFSPSRTFDLDGVAWEIRSADLGGDGDDDLFVRADALYVIEQIAPGEFAPARIVAPVMGSFCVHDIDGDGDLDLCGGTLSSRLGVAFGSEDGTFSPLVEFETEIRAGFVAVGDLTGDGLTDVVVSNFTDDALGVLLNGEDGVLRFDRSYEIERHVRDLTLADFDLDGDLDVVGIDVTFRDDVVVFLNEGDGSLVGPQVFGCADNPEALVVVDLNGDDAPDVAVCGSPGKVSVLFNRRARRGWRLPEPHARLQRFLSDAASGRPSADTNGDGRVDTLDVIRFCRTLYGGQPAEP